MREINDLRKSPPEGIRVQTNEEDMLDVTGIIEGPGRCFSSQTPFSTHQSRISVSEPWQSTRSPLHDPQVAKTPTHTIFHPSQRVHRTLADTSGLGFNSRKNFPPPHLNVSFAF